MTASDFNGDIFIPLYLTKDEVGSLQAVCEGFIEQACCAGHKHDATELAKLFKKLAKNRPVDDLSHLDWDLPVSDVDFEL